MMDKTHVLGSPTVKYELDPRAGQMPNQHTRYWCSVKVRVYNIDTKQS